MPERKIYPRQQIANKLGEILDFISVNSNNVSAIGIFTLNPDGTLNDQEWAHYSDISKIVNVVDGVPETYFIEIDAESYRNLALQLSASDATGAEFKLYATLDSEATVPATGGTPGDTWVEITTDIFGAALSGISISELAFIDTNIMPDRYLLQYKIQNAVNKVGCWIRKY